MQHFSAAAAVSGGGVRGLAAVPMDGARAGAGMATAAGRRRVHSDGEAVHPYNCRPLV